MKLDLNVKLPDLPRSVALSVLVITASVVLFGISYFTLGEAHDEAIVTNGRLIAQVAKTQKDIGTAQDDFQYVTENQERFEALLQSDRLVPHVRRAAVRQMQTLALQRRLSALNYDFAVVGEKSAAAVGSQAPNQTAPDGKSSSYRINVESVELKVGAPLDGQIYGFIQDLGKSFPGAAIVQSVELHRAPKVTQEMLTQVSRGEDSHLVNGEIRFLWRTAQANDSEKKP
jgi:hypothetical protein